MMQYDDNAEKYGYEGEMTPMKCDELKEYTNPTYGSSYYDIDEVDSAIAELKEAWRCEHEACETLKKKLADAQAGAYAEMVDAGMRERRLRRALWIERSDRAMAEAYNCHLADASNLWIRNARKMSAKAEEYR